MISMINILLSQYSENKTIFFLPKRKEIKCKLKR